MRGGGGGGNYALGDCVICVERVKARLHIQFFMRFRYDVACKTYPSLTRTGF